MKNVDNTDLYQSSQNIDTISEYKTADIYEATWLKSLGFNMTGAEWIGRSVFFVFEGENIDQQAYKWRFGQDEIVSLIKKFNQERENLFGLLKTLKGQMPGGAK
jgi:hypothetical protein